MIWRSRNRTLDLSKRGCIMGILNATPDSFSDAGQHLSLDRALYHARQMIAEGALIIDVGGESTRPGAPAVSAQEEHQRVIPIISALRREWDGWISIDTSKACVAESALAAGADIVNDVTGLRGDPEMAALCAQQHCAVVVMHMQGSPDTMQRNPQYGDVVEEVRAFFFDRYDALMHAGIDHDQICFDPGIGFGKTPEHNWLLLHHLTDLIIHQRPLLLGLSRKSFIGHSLQSTDIQHRSWPTVALTALGRERGALIHRVHEVQANEQALRMTEALLGA
ncbi:MAG: dihydropteroate synthase [Verrucomicrobia bacterium]|nr:MAG: dihydropteroate synthase [Verrucomicrobiota bacterium]